MSTHSNNLDLSDVDTDDLEKLSNQIETFYTQDSFVKAQLAWHWERNHLFLDGKQWVVFDGRQETGGIWRRLEPSRENEYIPRPVTNYIFDIYQTLKSYLIKNKPRSVVYPNTDTYRDKQSAKIATLCCEANWTRLREERNYEYAASVLVTYGTTFKKDYWDTTVLSMARIPRMEQTVGPDGPQETQAQDPTTGELLYDEVPLGDVNTAICEPYRMSLDPMATDIHNVRWIMEYTIQPLSWIKEMYGKDPEQNPGYTGLAEEVTAEKRLSASMRRFFDLKNSSGVKYGGIMEGGSPSDVMIDNAAVVKEYYERPTQKNPKGRLFIVANNKTLYSGDSPYSGPEQGDWHPYSEARWELVPGRFWGKGPLDEACDIQRQVNSIDTVITLVRKTSAIPQKLIPMGMGIERGSWTGRPGQEVYYRDLGTGAKPEVIPSSDVGEGVWKEREQRLSDLKEVTGAIDILRGDRPPGVTAASALNMLYEVGTGKLFPVLDRWKNFVESSQKKQLRLISKFYREPRPEFIRLLKMKNNELSEEAINKFIGSDLYDNCNVIVEAGSNVPKLQSTKQAMLLEVAQTGALALNQPANRNEFLRQLGITGFDTDIGPDTKRAEWENDLMDNIENSPANKPVVLDADNDQIHIDIHNRRTKEPAFMALPMSVQTLYMQHVQAHEQSASKKQQAQRMQQAAQGMTPQPQEQPQGAPAGPKSGHGAPTAVKNAMMGDSLTPASLGQGTRP